MQERRGGAELGRVPDSQASPSDLPPPLQSPRGVDLQRRETGSVRLSAGGPEGLDEDSWTGVPGRLRGTGRRRCGAPHYGRGGLASNRERGGGCAVPPARAPPFPPPLAPPLSSPPHSPPRLLCAGPAPAPSGPRPRPLRARDWPAGPLVGGAPGRPGAVYSKGRACAPS